MDSEQQLRSEFRHALDVILPPAPWLGTAVRKRIETIDETETGAPRRTPFIIRWPRAHMKLAAAVLVIAIAGAAVGVYLISHHNLSQEVPAGGRPGTISFGRINANGDETIFTIRADGRGGEKRLLSTPTCCAAWAHRGDRLLLNAISSTGLTTTTAIVNADGSGYRVLAADSSGLNLGPGNWSPDDSRIAFEGWDDHNASRNGIYTADAADGGGRRRVTTTTEHDVPLGYSPDGSMILFRRGPADRGQPGRFFVVGVDGGAARQVSPPGMTVWSGFFGAAGGWSADGALISFSAFSPIPSAAGRSAVFVAAGDGTNPRRITNWGLYTTSARFSPTANWIVFDRTAGDPATEHKFFLVRPDGTGTTLISSVSGGCCAVWSPDGNRLAFIIGPDNAVELWTMELDGSHITHLTIGRANLTDVSWSSGPS